MTITEHQRPTSGWRLAIDFGTTYTAAAIERDGRITTLLFDGSPRIASGVAVDDDGALLVGAVAERAMAMAPARAERCPKRRLGDAVLLLGPHAVAPVAAVAAVLGYVFDEAVRQAGGARPFEVILTHPARWGAVRLRLLAEAARLAGLPEPRFVAEPVAAAAAESQAAALGDGQVAAVFDLGGGTFDTAVVRREGETFSVIGPPGGHDACGGETFDERLEAHLGQLLARRNPEAWENLRFSEERQWRKAAYELRREVKAAKETLSSRSDAQIYLGAPIDAELRVTREEFEQLIQPDVQAALGELQATIEGAGLTPSAVRTVFLVGGSSRIPLAARLAGEWFGRLPITWGDPKAAVALGALMTTDAALRSATPTVEAPVVTAASATTIAATPAPDVGATRPAWWRRRAMLAAGAAIAALVAALVITIGGNGSPEGEIQGGSGSSVPSSVPSNPDAGESTAPTEASVATTISARVTPSTATTIPTTAATAATAATTVTTVGTTALPVTAAPATAAPATATPATTRPATVRATTPTTVPVADPPVAATTTSTTTTTTTAPPPPITDPPAPTSKTVPNVIGAFTSDAIGAIQQLGFPRPVVAAGSCDQSSIVTSYTPTGVQPLTTLITLFCS